MQRVLTETKNWLEKMVIGLNLCPFAGKVYREDKIRFVVAELDDLEKMFGLFADELFDLTVHPEVETTIIVMPKLFSEFEDFNEYIPVFEAFIDEMGFTEDFQLATFHPEYQFANEAVGGVSNYTNRSPYPILHLLRSKSVEFAIKEYGDTDLIPIRNIEKLEQIGKLKIQQLLATVKMDE